MTQADWELVLSQRREIDGLRRVQQQRDGKIFDSILDAWVFWDGRVQSVNEGASIDSVDREAAG